MWCWKCVEKISWIERKTNEGVFRTVKEKRTETKTLENDILKNCII